MSEQYVLLTSGEYSYFSVSGLIVGPAEPPFATLTEVFYREYLPVLIRVRDTGDGHTFEQEVRDIETARKRLLSEGVAVNTQENHYGQDGTAYGSSGELLHAWLIACHGYRDVPYIEAHEGRRGVVGEDE